MFFLEGDIPHSIKNNWTSYSEPDVMGHWSISRDTPSPLPAIFLGRALSLRLSIYNTLVERGTGKAKYLDQESNTVTKPALGPVR